MKKIYSVFTYTFIILNNFKFNLKSDAYLNKVAISCFKRGGTGEQHAIIPCNSFGKTSAICSII